MTIAVDGIVSGLDTSSIIDSLVAVYSVPKEGLEDQVEDYEDKQEALTNLMSRLDDLSSALATLNESTDFRAYTASSSDETAVLAEATGEAIAGAYTVEVDQLATSELEVSDQSFASTTAADTIAYGDYTITYGSNDPVTISLASDETSLNDLVAAINEQVEGVTAYVVNDGSDTDPYKLVLVGEETGSDNTISFAAGATFGAGAVPTFTETQSAQDASFTINGISIDSASNIVSSAVPGLQLTLTQQTTSPITVTVTEDRETMQQNVQAFVDAYNEVIDYIDTQSVYNADSGIRAPFVGESSVQRVASGLAAAITDQYSSGSAITALSLIGIHTDSSGNLEFDTEEFGAALDSHYEEVEAMFTSDDGFAAALLGTDTTTGLIDVYVDSDSGTLQTRYDSLDSRIDELGTQIERYEARIERYEARLRSQYEAMEVTLGVLESTTSYLEALLSSDSNSSS
jgi:flagellar hook-associated protein 2